MQGHRHSGSRRVSHRQPGQNRNAETGGDKRPDSLEFAAFAGDPGFESRGPTSRQGGFPGPAFVKDKRFEGKLGETDAALFRGEMGFRHKGHKRLGKQERLVKPSA